MYATSYDIIDWKSCESYSQSASAQVSRDIASGTEIIFPKLFHERRENSETSIVSSNPDFELPDGPLQFYNSEYHADSMEQQSVYQKVANWVLTQRNYFRNVEQQVRDDDIEVIDPVDLFHESILNDYQVITENDLERRELLRHFETHRYHIESIEQAMLINDYRFLRKPKGNIELELTPIIEFHTLYKNETAHRKRKRRNSSSSSTSSYIEQGEEQIRFLGVPRLLENYVILNREGYVVTNNPDRDIWLEPLNEFEAVDEPVDEDELDMDFISSWFSDVYQTDLNTDEVRTLVTVNTDILEKVTVISVSNASDEDVWVDAPDIPHWLDEDYEELELFNQPSRPLYYYRDRIKGCYRIVGVEDETVVLFSGNDDDSIFYPGECESWDENQQSEEDRLGRFVRTDSDRKNDSGIEDDIVAEDIAIASLSLSKKQDRKLDHKTALRVNKRVTFSKDMTENSMRVNTKSFIEILWLVLGCVFILTAAMLIQYTLNEGGNGWWFEQKN